MSKLRIIERRNRAASQSTLQKVPLDQLPELLNQSDAIEPNIMDKLLLPPLQKQNSKSESKKAKTACKKPDLESVIHENIQLKKNLNDAKLLVSQIKVKLRDSEAKNAQLKVKLRENTDNLEKGPSSVYFLILKEKIQELNAKCQEQDQQIERLRKLPNANIFSQSRIQKEHLVEETIRLNAKLLALTEKTQVKGKGGEADSNNARNNEANSSNSFQNKFIKILKEENENLKGTIRLLENDKVMMKTNLSIQLKKYQSLGKDYNEMKIKFAERVEEIERLTEENKNLLFKKLQQYQFSNQQKEQKEVKQLQKQIEENRIEMKKMSEDYKLLTEDNRHLKQKEKLKTLELLEVEQKYENLRFQMAEMEEDEGARSNHANSKRPTNRQAPSSIINDAYLGAHEAGYESTKPSKSGLKNFHDERLGKAVKFSDITLALLIVSSLKMDQVFTRFEEIFWLGDEGSPVEKNIFVSFKELQLMFSSAPLSLPIDISVRLSCYIFEDHFEVIDSTPVIQTTLAMTILKSATNRMLDTLDSKETIRRWRLFLNKKKNFVRQVEEIDSDYILNDHFFDLVLHSRNFDLTEDEKMYIQVVSFSRAQSQKQIYLSKQKIIECLTKLEKDESNESVSFRNDQLTSSVATNQLNVRGNRSREGDEPETFQVSVSAQGICKKSARRSSQRKIISNENNSSNQLRIDRKSANLVGLQRRQSTLRKFQSWGFQNSKTPGYDGIEIIAEYGAREENDISRGAELSQPSQKSSKSSNEEKEHKSEKSSKLVE